MSNDEKLKLCPVCGGDNYYGKCSICNHLGRISNEKLKDYSRIELEKLSTDNSWVDGAHELVKQIESKARAEVIAEIKIKVMEVIDERINAGMDDLEGADYKEFVQADFFIMAMGIVKSEVIKVLTKLSEGK